jgi:hypothetical protein
MNLEDWQILHDRLDQAHRNSIGMRLGAREFWTWHRSVYELLQQANAEWVNCRRRGHSSPKFNDLLTQADATLKTFEAHILMAKLMHKEQR